MRLSFPTRPSPSRDLGKRPSRLETARSGMGTLICGHLGRRDRRWRREGTELSAGQQNYRCLRNHRLDLASTSWIPSLTLKAVVLVPDQDIMHAPSSSMETNPPLAAVQYRMVKVKGPKGIDSEYHFLPWSFEPCRRAHFFQRLPLSPSTSQGRSRAIDRGRHEYHRS